MGGPRPFFLLWGLPLWLWRYLLCKVDDFFWNECTEWVLQPLVMPGIFQAEPASLLESIPKPLGQTERAALSFFQATTSNFF